jgi:hypothetical protein
MLFMIGSFMMFLQEVQRALLSFRPAGEILRVPSSEEERFLAVAQMTDSFDFLRDHHL